MFAYYKLYHQMVITLFFSFNLSSKNDTPNKPSNLITLFYKNCIQLKAGTILHVMGVPF